MIIPIKLPKEQKDQIISDLQSYYKEERSEELGSLGAEQIIDFMIKAIGPYIYNKAIEDARTLFNDRMMSMEEEFYTLEKPIIAERSKRYE